MRRRKELFDALLCESEAPAARDLMQAMMQPLVELMERDGEAGERYLRMLCRLQADGELEGRFDSFRYGEAVGRLEPLFEKACPDLAPDERRIRLRLALDLMLRGLANWSGFAERLRGSDALPAFVAVLLDFLAGGLEVRPAPASPPGQRKTSS
jgi:hypothetical protein